MRTILTIFFLCVILIAGCSENSVNPSSRDYEIPSGVGSFWKYALLNSISQEQDTIEVIIISSVSFLDGKSTLWSFKNLLTVDTVNVTFAENTICAELCSFSQVYKFVLFSPIIIGQSYQTNCGPMEVLSKEPVTIGNNTFEDCFYIMNHVVSSKGHNTLNYWIKPGIGVVKIHRSYCNPDSLHPQEVSWSLIDYNIVR